MYDEAPPSYKPIRIPSHWQDSGQSRETKAYYLGVLQGNFPVTLIEGDGIGPEISQAVKDIFAAARVPIKWEPVDVTPTLKDGRTVIPDSAIDSVKKNYVALKGPLAVGFLTLYIPTQWPPRSSTRHLELTYHFISIDTHRQRPRLSEPDSAPHI